MFSSAAQTADHAVVIGIQRYADVGAGWISDLQGPDNDAAEVATWLRDPQGGGLPADHVRVLRSADAPDPFTADRVEPHQKLVIQALTEVAQLPSNAYRGQWAGRRLYVYVSGHGWANRRNEAALVTAEASRALPINVLITSWVEWMARAAPFQELVFWGDTCATRTPLTHLYPCDLPDIFSMNAPSVRTFAAYAAPVGLAAVENQMPDGKWHGAFTYALLQGLRGAAATPVTSDSLRDYLLNAVRSFISDRDRKRATVAKEPAFGFTDAMEFGSPRRPEFPVVLRFRPEAVGHRVFVGNSRAAPPVAETVLTEPEWVVPLAAGAYAVFVEATGAMQEFQVVGGGADGPVDVP
ncbi:MAG TPA: caspase family protein [Propionibacteriaceae bacterium]|nr:caspase family protein [Propionibacteriaceae bacterium]